MRILIVIIILLEAVSGVLYAVNTPRWQAPDEPAQFNYVRHIAETGTLPELKPGDYDQDYLEQLKADRFPAEASVDRIRYESYQPPLYYLAATPVYLAARAAGSDAVLALRLFSVALGVALLALAYRVFGEVFPTSRFLAVAGVGLMATVPMHIAMSAAINADTLAEVIGAAILLVALLRVKGRLGDRPFVVAGGILYGLALLTSTKIYAAFALLIIAEIGLRWRASGRAVDRKQLADGIRSLALVAMVALLISGWWFIRNAGLYGLTDIFGWARHDAVVMGQPTTAEWIARYGLKSVVGDFFTVSFKSFWAQFGWMAVLVNDRIYVALFLLTGAAGLGAALWAVRMLRERGKGLGDTGWTWLILGAWLVIVLLAHAWYNMRYVQPQGRYLFPALVPIAALFVVGLDELLDKRYLHLIFGLLYGMLLLLDFVSLYWFIIPQLAR